MKIKKFVSALLCFLMVISMPLTSVKAEEPKSSTLSDTSYEYSKITDY